MTAETLGSARTCVDCAAVADCHWLPQWVYVKDTCNHVLRFENLESDFSELMQRFSSTVSDSSKIPSYAFSRTEPAQVSECGSLTKDDLDLKSRTLLATVFAEDYRRFGYELPDASTSKSALATMLQDDKKLRARARELLVTLKRFRSEKGATRLHSQQASHRVLKPQ